MKITCEKEKQFEKTKNTGKDIRLQLIFHINEATALLSAQNENKIVVTLSLLKYDSQRIAQKLIEANIEDEI